jgi:hypothetical protein
MWARVTEVQGDPAHLDDAIRVIEAQVLPLMRETPGTRGSYWLADRQSGRLLVVAFWETEEALRFSAEAIAHSRTETTQQVGATVQSVNEYEVVAHS